MGSAIDWKAFNTARRETVLRDLREALHGVTDQELRAWALAVPGIATQVTLRRGRNAKAMVVGITEFAKQEWMMASDAWRVGVARQHLKFRAQDLGATTRDCIKNARDICEKYSVKVVADPRGEAPVLVAGVIGFLIGSGGFDGDGGVPDLDLLGGIGAHRSLLTHTIVAGIVSETLILSTAELARRFYSRLPKEHDPVWDVLAQNRSREIDALSRGLSLGLSYHFAVDASLDSGGSFAALKGIISETTDNVLQGANAAVEAIDALKRKMDKR